MDEIAIKVEHVTKEYKLGSIGGGTLRGDLQSWWASVRGKEDPNSMIGSSNNGKRGERFQALKDVSFSVKKGEALGIIGHNGAGKSTLLKLLSRVTGPTSGTISYNGRIASMLEVGTGFHPELTGRENVYMNGAILGMTKAEIDRKFDQIVEFAEMEQFIDTPVKRYSSGMYVKLAFAVAAHLDSEIMVMDEVLAVGDVKFQKKCLGKMDDAANAEGRTVLYVSHNMSTIRQLCSRCIVLNHGKIIYDGNVEEAIRMYEGIDLESSTETDYSLTNRPLWLTSENVRIKYAAICDENGNPLQKNRLHGNTLYIKLLLENRRAINNICFRMEVRTNAGVIVGTSIVRDLPMDFNMDQQEMLFSLCIDSLADDQYATNYVLFTTNEFGACQNIDWVHGIGFSKQLSGDRIQLDWDKGHWGNIKLPEMKLELGAKKKRV